MKGDGWSKDQLLPLYLTETLDFPRQPVTVTIPPSDVTRRDFQGSVSIEIDIINEPEEIFLLLVEPTEETANDAEAPNIIFENNGLTIARIVDDDGQLFYFLVSTFFLFFFFLLIFLYPPASFHVPPSLLSLLP